MEPSERRGIDVGAQVFHLFPSKGMNASEHIHFLPDTITALKRLWMHEIDH